MSDLTAPPLPHRLARSLRARLGAVRAWPLLSADALREQLHTRGGYPADPGHRPHLFAALGWLERAQDAAGGEGIARGYSLVWNPWFRSRGWQPAYPETTGYIIPTLLTAARRLSRPGLAGRALRAARWESAVQMECGAVQGGTTGEPPTPAVFNTGQVILGWLAALEETGDESFAAAARRAVRWLVSVEHDGRFERGESRYARAGATAYNARTAWAMAEAGEALGEPAARDAAARVLRAVASAQHADGWFPACCLNDPQRPLLHTLAYTARGLVEGGRVLGDDALLRAGAKAAGAIAAAVDGRGWLPGRFAAGWAPAARWSCLTGQAQMANIWLRLDEIRGTGRWREPARRVLAFVKTTQDRAAPAPGVRGGIAGSWPAGGEYGRWEMLSWAAKFFADALMRDDAAGGDGPAVSRLA
jgi:hypothetical protein